MIKRLKQLFFIQLILRSYEMWITYLPGKVGQKLRYIYWKKRLNHLGEEVILDIGVKFIKPEYISINDKCWIDRFVTIIGGPDKSDRNRKIKAIQKQIDPGKVYIGKRIHIGAMSLLMGKGGIYISENCTLSSGVKMYSISHHYKSLHDPGNTEYYFGSQAVLEKQFLIEGPIYLGANVGIALNSVILPGVCIEKNSFVTINSVVTTSFGENSLISGNPAGKKGSRFEKTS